MVKGQNIICFGSESWAYTGFQQTVMRLLARENKVLYVNALGSRKVSLDSSQFLFYLKRAGRLFQKSIEKSTNTLIYNPSIIPLVYSSLVTRINRMLIRTQFSRLISKMNFQKHILWIGTPTVAPLLDVFDPVLTVYNPVDRYYAFQFVNSIKIRNYERKIAEKADVIICTSEAIKKDLSPYNENCVTVTHGVDFDHFNSALTLDKVPEDIKDIPKPVIGYFGGLSERVNYNLMYDVAIEYPNANVVLIGKKTSNLGKIEKLANVHVLGFKDFASLPSYLKHFTVSLIPYHVNELMEGVDPIKLREYLCLGKPVVTVDLPEVGKFRDLLYIGENEIDFVDKISKAMQEDNPSLIERRIQEAKRSDWNNKIGEISRIINGAFARR